MNTINVCSGTLALGFNSYSLLCLRKVFGGKKVCHILDLSINDDTGAGDTGCAPKNFTSKYGIWFRISTRDPHFSPKGFPMEGVSVEPNHEVKQTVTDFFDDKDSIIEYVLNELI